MRANVLVFCALFMLLPALAGAQSGNYPNRSIRFVVGNSVGGGEDTSARLIAPKLVASLGQQLVIDNRPGATGSLAAEITAKAQPDGHVILLTAMGALAVNPSLFKQLNYDPLRDFVPVTGAVSQSNILVVHPSVPASSVKELIAVAKARAGKLTFGSSGSGNAGHLSGELFKTMAQVNMVHVPYKGGAPAMIDLVGGRVDLIFSSAPTALPQIKAGRIKAIAVTTPKRSAVAPELPTIAEAGLPGFEATNWYGIVVPAKTPAPVVQRLNAEIVRALSAQDTVAALFTQGLEPMPMSPQQFGAYMRSESAKWAKVIKDAGIQAE